MPKYIWSEGAWREIKGAVAKGPGDVYFKNPGLEPNLADDKHPHGYHVRSRRHKSELMRQLGVREAGDRVHGSRYRHVRNQVDSL